MRSVALCERGPEENGAMSVMAEVVSPSERGGRFASLISEVFEEAGIAREALDQIAIGVGPGSAAGIRSTLSFAIGWQIANRVPAYGISSVWAVAAQAQLDGVTGQFNVILKGPIGRMILASFAIRGKEIKEVTASKMVSLEEFGSLSMPSNRFIGPDVETILSPLENETGQGSVPRELLTIFPTGKALGSLLLNQTTAAIYPLEPLVLTPPTFVKAPDPRVIPEV